MKRAMLAAMVVGVVAVGLVAGGAQARPSRAALSSGTVYTFTTGVSKVVAGKNNQGWWSSNVNNNNPTNDNYVVGSEPGQLYHDYFTFDISGFGNNCALGTSATLTIPTGGFGVGPSFLPYDLFDVSTDPLVLNKPAGTNQPNPTIYNDLGSGKSYGQFVLPTGNFFGATLQLNSVALAAINQAHTNGQQFFSVGGAIPNAVPTQYLFSGTGFITPPDTPVKLTVTVPKICRT